MIKKWLIFFISLVFFLSGNYNVIAAESNKPYNWGFKRSTNHEPPTAGMYEKILEKHGSFFLADTTKKEIYLTFDNGYEQGYTEKVLNILKDKKVPAAFFVTGDYLNQRPDLIKRMVNEGHIVGNHSWSHPDMTSISDEKIKQELNKVEKKFEELTGVKGMQYLRPPRGVFSERTLAVSKEAGYTNVFWSLAFVDWKTDNQKGWKYAYDNIMKQIHPGAILLLHTVSKDNAEALAKVIDDLRKEGYSFKSLDEYMLKDYINEPMLLDL